MRNNLAQILIDNFGLSEDDLAESQTIKSEKGGSLGDILLQQNVISEPKLLEALSRQYDLPYWSKLPLDHIESGFTKKIPIQFLKKFYMVPLEYLKPITAADCGLAGHSPADSEKEAASAGHVISIIR